MPKIVGWRKIAGSIWGPPNDPQVYGAMEFDATPLQAYIDRARDAGHRITVTHLVGQAMAHAMHDVPDFNVRIRGGRFYPRESVDIFYITSVEGGRSLSGVKVERANEKSVLEVANELTARAGRQKRGDDPEFAKTKKLLERTPLRIMRISMRFAAWMSGDLDRNVKALGVEKSTFGSAMITSVGMFGLPQGFAPLARFYRVPMIVLVGEITDKPVAIDGRVEIRPILPLTATIDHRYADGWHISQLLKPFRAYMAAPEEFEPTPDSVAPAPAEAPAGT